jgi:gliding motility-associated-like protein
MNEISASCSPFEAILHSTSTGDHSKNWYLDNQYLDNQDDITLNIENNSTVNQTHSIKLTASHEIGCNDTFIKTFEVYATPELFVSNDMLICPKDTVQLFANGSISYLWSPNYNISDTTARNPFVYPLENTEYHVTTTNEYDCSTSASTTVNIQENINIYLESDEYTINIGECLTINIESSQNSGTYSWTPDYNISCIDCPNPNFCPDYDTVYFLTVQDSLQCFVNEYEIRIIVNRLFTIDVPTIFTPLTGDGNSIVYVRGIGIKKLKYFRIFNRWGQEIFATDDLYTGWDGTFKGVIQNIDNYAFTVEAEMINGTTEFKKGFIMLSK